ncbi:MAG: RdgB/HAM1 family non-canonical purine NTP pyrophosphatase [Actinobacteria bacterium]|mgnify:CR=1 FL=1|nr:RdgB/HAM1 family non-canonical purine NTP pyrophosphatase [Actinomycetota bacterium]
MTEIVLASRNHKKVEELLRILESQELAVTVRSLAEFPEAPEVPETESTFVANAMLKAHAIAEFTGLPAVADDSGLCVDALNGMPGVLSARWAGGHGDDAANLRLVLDQLQDVPEPRRGAQFRCAAALAVPDSVGGIGLEQAVEGEVSGRLLTEPRGQGGFGYDPIFVPDGYELTTAELTPAAKDAISHRGAAFRALAQLLPRLLVG